jgi:hypothetical protein
MHLKGKTYGLKIHYLNDESSILSYSSVLITDSGKILSFVPTLVPTHNLKSERVAHTPSTCPSVLRASLESEGFGDISDWLSCVSNKLFNSWHVESYA